MLVNTAAHCLLDCHFDSSAQGLPRFQPLVTPDKSDKALLLLHGYHYSSQLNILFLGMVSEYCTLNREKDLIPVEQADHGKDAFFARL